MVGLYMNPPDHAVVLAVDEKTQVQALDRTRPSVRPARDPHAKATTTSATAPSTSMPRSTSANRGGHPPAHSPAPGHRVQVLEPDRQERAQRPRRPPGHRQRFHPQDPGHQEVAARPPPVPRALHADVVELAQPGRAVVRRDHHQVDPPGHPPQREGARRLHHLFNRTWNENPRPYVWTKTADEILESLADIPYTSPSHRRWSGCSDRRAGAPFASRLLGWLIPPRRRLVAWADGEA